MAPSASSSAASAKAEKRRKQKLKEEKLREAQALKEAHLEEKMAAKAKGGAPKQQVLKGKDKRGDAGGDPSGAEALAKKAGELSISKGKSKGKKGDQQGGARHHLAEQAKRAGADVEAHRPEPQHPAYVRGLANMQAGKLAEAGADLRVALTALEKEEGNPGREQVGSCMMMLGQLNMIDDRERAIEDFTAAISAYEAAVIHRGYTVDSLQEHCAGKMEQLLAAMAGSPEFGKAISGVMGASNCRLLRAQAYLGLKTPDLQKSQTDALSALEAFRSLADGSGVARASVALACALADQAPDSAMELLKHASELFGHLGEKRLAAEAIVARGRIQQGVAAGAGAATPQKGVLPTGPDSDDEDEDGSVSVRERVGAFEAMSAPDKSGILDEMD